MNKIELAKEKLMSHIIDSYTIDSIEKVDSKSALHIANKFTRDFISGCIDKFESLFENDPVNILKKLDEAPDDELLHYCCLIGVVLETSQTFSDCVANFKNQMDRMENIKEKMEAMEKKLDSL